MSKKNEKPEHQTVSQMKRQLLKTLLTISPETLEVLAREEMHKVKSPDFMNDPHRSTSLANVFNTLAFQARRLTEAQIQRSKSQASIILNRSKI